jgi:L-rhamnose mutarotase
MSTSKPQGPRHVGQFLYLRPECIPDYKKCHAAVWPEVLEQIKDSNIEDCNFPSPSIYSPPSSHLLLSLRR